jgi:methyl-accepting chemotaxis protein
MGTIGPIISLVTKLTDKDTRSKFKSTIAAGLQSISNGVLQGTWLGVAAGEIAAQVAGWPLLVIMLAILAVVLILVVAIVALVAAFNAIKNATPEAKLAAAEEAAKAAGEAAKFAADAYKELKEGLADLDKSYDALDNMTKGTQEWKDAVKDVNKQVLDLVDKYPELAKYVEKTNDGVLKLDTDSEEVEAVMKSYENKATMAENMHLATKVDVNEAKKEMAYKETTGSSKIGA